MASCNCPAPEPGRPCPGHPTRPGIRPNKAPRAHLIEPFSTEEIVCSASEFVEAEDQPSTSLKNSEIACLRGVAPGRPPLPSLAEPRSGMRDHIKVFLGLPSPRSSCCLPKGLAPSLIVPDLGDDANLGSNHSSMVSCEPIDVVLLIIRSRLASDFKGCIFDTRLVVSTC